YLIGLLFCTQIAFGSAAHPQKPISVHFENTRLKEVFKELNTEFGLQFIYSNKDLDESKRITLKLENTSVDKVVDQLFSTIHVPYEIKDNTIIIKREVRASAQQQQRTIKGQVFN